MAGGDGRSGIGTYLFRAVIAALWIGGGYYGLFGSEYSAFELRELRTERNRVAGRLDSVRAVSDSLRRRAERLVEDTLLIQRVAREEHGLIRDGEILYRFVPARPGSAEGTGGGSRSVSGDPRR